MAITSLSLKEGLIAGQGQDQLKGKGATSTRRRSR